MSTKTLKDEKKLPKQMMFSKKCLGIVLKRVTTGEKALRDCTDCESGRNGELHRRCSSVSTDGSTGDDWMYESGYLIYQEFQEENRQCFWNTILVDSVSNVEYMGYVAPGTLLVCGNEYYLEAVRSAWARRVLRSPANFIITRLGDVTGLEIQVIPQTQFTPLPEALCLVVSELNLDEQTASLDVIFSNLRERFSDMIIPNQEVVYSSLGKLIKDRKVYHTGDGYFIVTPETYHMTTMSSFPERPLLMSNEEAIHKLHGGELVLSSKNLSETRTRSIQTNMANSDEDFFLSPSVSHSASSDRHLSMSKLDRTGSLRLSRKEKHRSEENTSFARSESMRLSPEKCRSLIKDINLKSSPAHREVEKGEKISVFSKLFRRSSSKRRKGSKSPAKYATFSAQFPPLEWNDPDMIHFHSRSTQTLSKESRSFSPSKNTLKTTSTAPSSAVTSSSSMNIISNNNNNVTNNNGLSSGNPLTSNYHLNSKSNAAISSPPPPCSASPPITNTNDTNVHTPIKCKTDSLTRLRDADKSSTHHHHRGRSSNRYSTDIKPHNDSSIDSRPMSSGLPRKSVYHTSSSELNSSGRLYGTSGGSRTHQLASSRLSASHLVSPARYSRPHSTSRNSSSVQDATKGSLGMKGDGIRGIVDQESFHSSATSLNRTETEAKVKNTDVRTDEEYKMTDLAGGSNEFGSDLSLKKGSARYTNRWSIHGNSETGSLRAPMNNVTVGQHRNSPLVNGKQPRIKCVNKLNHSSSSVSPGGSGSGPQTRSPNVTAAIRPTQAIKPLNQHLNSEKSAGDKKVPNGDSCNLVSSPSFTKSFDLESSDFKSITALKLLKGISVNSIDTLVEVNLVATERKQDEDKEECPKEMMVAAQPMIEKEKLNTGN